MAEANKERIFDEFVELVSVPCHTLKERQVFELLQQKLKDLGFVTQEDDAGKELGGECGNLWGWLPGNKVGAKRVLLTAHMDCVEPCEGIKVVKKDGKILSDGTTILGSDDKSGVVAILEAVRMLQETKAEHGNIQVLFTIAEEGGVNGSRCMDKSLLALANVRPWIWALALACLGPRDMDGPNGPGNPGNRNYRAAPGTGQGTF